MSAPESFEVSVEPLRRNVERWNATSRTTQDLDDRLELLLQAVEPVLDCVETLCEGARLTLVALEDRGELSTGGLERLREQVGGASRLEVMAQGIRHARSLIAAAREVKA